MDSLDSFSENTHISNFIKAPPVGSALFHAYGQTDVTNLIIAFRNFANASKTAFICRESNQDFSVSSLEHNHYTDRAILIVAFRNFANGYKHSEHFDTYYQFSVYEGKGFIVHYNGDIVGSEIYN